MVIMLYRFSHNVRMCEKLKTLVVNLLVRPLQVNL
jgi:hypothetical protein